MLLNAKDLRAMVRAEKLAKRESEGIYCPQINIFADVDDDGKAKIEINPRKEDRKKFWISFITIGVIYLIFLLIFAPYIGPHSDAGLILTILGGVCIFMLLPSFSFLTTKKLVPEQVWIFVDHVRDYDYGSTKSNFDYYNFVKLSEKHGDAYLRLAESGKLSRQTAPGTPYIIILNRESGKIMYAYNAYKHYLDVSFRDSVKSPLDVDINPEEFHWVSSSHTVILR